MRTLLLFLALLFATPEPSHAQTVDIQLLYQGNRHPRHLIAIAKRHYKTLGITINFTPIRLRHIERPTQCGMFLLYANMEQMMQYLPGGKRTIILVPPPLSSVGNEVLCGVAPICGITGAVTRMKKSPNGTAWILIHEIAHMLGATHTAEPTFLSPAWSSGDWVWSSKTVDEIHACMRWS